MKPSSKIVLCLSAAFCCGATAFAGSAAAVQARSFTPMSGKPVIAQKPVVAQKPVMTQKIGREGHPQHMSSEEFRRSIDRRFRGGRSFDSGSEIGPYYSGTFPAGPIEDGEPPIYPPGYPDYSGYPDYYGPVPRPQPCVVPLVIELRRSRPSRHLPKITYGSPSSCPPPIVAEAP